MKIILYTIDCPKCKILEKKLNMNNIQYDICKDTKLMKEKNIQKLPMLSINERLYSYKEAVDLINKGGIIWT